MSTIETVKAQSVELKEFKKALSTFEFWYKILLETEYMNDVDDRIEYQAALKTIVTHTKKKKGI